MPYVFDGNTNTDTIQPEWGKEAYRRNSLANAVGYGDGDATAEGVQNALIGAGLTDEAAKLQNISGARTSESNAIDSNERANAAESRARAADARTIEAINLAKKVGQLYASGDTTGARNAALQGGNLALAGDYSSFGASEADRQRTLEQRAAMKTAADLSASGDTAGATKVLMPYYATPQALVDEAKASRDTVNKNFGQFALTYEGNPEGWKTTGLDAMKKMGMSIPDGMDPEAFRKQLLAQSGLATTVYGGDTKKEIADMRADAKTTAGSADTRRAEFQLAQFQADPANQGIQVPQTEIQKLAADKNYVLKSAQGPDGSKTAIAVLVDGRTRGLVDAAERAVKENQDANAKDGGGRPTDFATVYRFLGGKDIQQQNANTRALSQDVDHQRNLKQAQGEGMQTGKADAGMNTRAATAETSQKHIDMLRKIRSEPGFEDAIGVINSMGGLQDALSAIDSGRVHVPSQQGRVITTLGALSREFDNSFHLPGTGVDAIEKNAIMRKSFESMMKSPNGQVFDERLDNYSDILKAIVDGTSPGDIMRAKYGQPTAVKVPISQVLRNQQAQPQNTAPALQNGSQAGGGASPFPEYPNARQGKDGHFYVQQGGQYFRVDK